MSDVADILGKKKGKAASAEDAILAEARGAGGRGARNTLVNKSAKKPGGRKNMSREVLGLMDEGKPPLMPAPATGVGAIVAQRGSRRRATRWAWRPFTSSARRDNLELCHWVRAASEFPDYPFVRFNKRVEVVRYTDDEYRRLLTPVSGASVDDLDARWTREHTDLLMDLCRRYDLRWPVILDRFHLRPPHSIEDMQQRFFSVSARVLTDRARSDRSRSESRRNPYSNFSFHSEDEVRRRRLIDRAFRLRAEHVVEEGHMLTELRLIDAHLERLRLAGPESVEGQILALAQKAEQSAAGSGGEALHAAKEAEKKSKETEKKSKETSQATSSSSNDPSEKPTDETAESSAEVSTPAAASSSAAAAAAAPEGKADSKKKEEGPLMAFRGEPRGGWKAWTTRAKVPPIDAFRGVSLRTEQLISAPDALTPESRTMRKVTSLLGEMGVPAAHRMAPTAATLRALTRLRRACVCLFQLQRAVRSAEHLVRQAQLRRKQVCAIRLGSDNPLEDRRIQEEAAKATSQAIARAAVPRPGSNAHARARLAHATATMQAAVAATSTQHQSAGTKRPAPISLPPQTKRPRQE